MKKIAVIFLLFVCSLYSVAASAAIGTDQSTTFSKSIDANGRAWTISPGGTTDAGARLYRAVDNTGARSWATVAPSASSITRNLVRGANGLAVATAVAGIVGAAADYLLDPANNQVIVKGDSNSLYSTAGRPPVTYDQLESDSCSYAAAVVAEKGITMLSCSVTSITQDGNTVTPRTNMQLSRNGSVWNETGGYIYNKVSSNPDRNISYDQVANQILNDSKSKPESKQYSDDSIDKDVQNNENTTINNITNQITNNYINSNTEPSSDANPITNNSTTVVNNTYNTTNNTTNNTYNQAPELPEFCNWAGTVCDWIQWFKTEYQTAKNALITEYQDVKEKVRKWFTDEPQPEDGKLYPEEIQVTPDESRFNFGGQCPAPINIEISFMGNSQNVQLSYEPLCYFLEMIRPFVIAASYLVAAYIIMGLSRGNSE